MWSAVSLEMSVKWPERERLRGRLREKRCPSSIIWSWRHYNVMTLVVTIFLFLIQSNPARPCRSHIRSLYKRGYFQPRSRPFVWLLARTWIRKSSIKPPGGLFLSSTLRGGLIERGGGLFKEQCFSRTDLWFPGGILLCLTIRKWWQFSTEN